jgi:methylmalonyl-CoA epimerase
MKAILDHVGIAVQDIEQALAFYRDALGLEIEPAEEVRSQRVRAHVIPTGQGALELLEPTAPDSPIARYVEKRGPGVHHVTLRVQDIGAALDHLRARGVRLIDQQPRPGAQSSLIAFIHPSSSHGVLVELKEHRQEPFALASHRLPWGDLELVSLHDGLFRLDGGSVFGAVARPVWEAQALPDDRHRVVLGIRPLVVEADWGRMIIDCGVGDKMSVEQRDLYALDRTRHLDHALADVGLSAEAIDLVVATHLHFDHVGGATIREHDALKPRFPRARYLIRAAEWEEATHPHERSRASYLPDDFLPLKEAGVADFHDGDCALRPGVRVVRTGGHCPEHQIIFLESAGKTAVFAADLIPTTAHIRDAWVMGHDLFPMETLAFKRHFIREAIDREYLMFFVHDPLVSAGYIREAQGRRYVEQVL